MNDNENRKRDMFLRAQQFFSTRPADFAAGSIGKQLITELGATITELDDHAAAETSGGGVAREGTITRAQARAALREDLEAINRTARLLDDEPGLREKFRVPRGRNDQQLLDAGRSAAVDAVPYKARFIALELPAGFLEDLEADITAMEQSMGEQSAGHGDRVAASAAIDEAIEVGTAIVRKLDGIVKNKYGNQRATMAEWTSASHTERAPRKKTGVGTPTPPAGGPPSSPPPSGSA